MHGFHYSFNHFTALLTLYIKSFEFNVTQSVSEPQFHKNPRFSRHS